jgi:hypothetical protein
MLSKSSITQEEREEAERYKAENEIPDDPKRATQPWSGVRRLVERISKEPHPSDLDDSTQDLREKEKAIGYTDTASYVHCTQPGLNSYTYRWKEPILLPRSSRANSSAQKTCMLIRVHLVEIIRYSLFGMGCLQHPTQRRSRLPNPVGRCGGRCGQGGLDPPESRVLEQTGRAEETILYV